MLLRWTGRVVAGVVALALLTVGVTAARVWWVARVDDRARTDAIVVLGASQYDGRPSPVFAARLDHARRLYRAGVAPVVVTVGGGQPGDRFTEAEAGARYLTDRGVTGVVAVGTGSNTLQSLQAVQQVLQQRGWRSVTVVTDPWHSLRSAAMAGDLGISARTSPSRAGPAVRTRSTQARYIGRETLAYLYYRVFRSSAETAPPAV